MSGSCRRHSGRPYARAYRFFDHEGVTRDSSACADAGTAARAGFSVAKRHVSHDVGPQLHGTSAQRDLIPVGNDHTFGYELFQTPRHCRGVLPSVASLLSCALSPFCLRCATSRCRLWTILSKPSERSMPSKNSLPQRRLIHLFDRGVRRREAASGTGDRRYVVRCRNLSRRRCAWPAALARHAPSVALKLQPGGALRRQNQVRPGCSSAAVRILCGGGPNPSGAKGRLYRDQSR